ncbi:thioredoxin domain-containing protein [Actinotalea sp. K2]|uniref:DsbA family protein n=1 Tax=Actinotalea sp. K2 TaxID=2939438 RepID=UPI002017D948|nr:thioredoxin domain-containing protein [Actinotalea sp. K2]MCL3861504.1 DsbA family protein [Actinotalea sp. K2]
MSTAPRTTKADRREEARVAALRLREEQQRAARRQRTIVIGALVAGLAGLAVLVTIILGQANASPIEDVARPAGSTLSGAIPVGQEGIAGRTDGTDPDAVVVSVYSDFLCPYCALFEELGGPVLDEYREAGDIVVEYHPVSILDRESAGSVYSTRAAVTVAFVADQAPEAFVELNQLLMANQPAEGVVGLTDEQMADLARQAGVPEEVAAQIAAGEHLGDGTAGDAPAFTPWVRAATEQASKDLGRLQTPTILIDGEPLDESVDWREEGRLAEAIDAARG